MHIDSAVSRTRRTAAEDHARCESCLSCSAPMLWFFASTSSKSCVIDWPVPGLGAAAVLCVSWRCAAANCQDRNNKIPQPALICMAALLLFETNRNFDRKDSVAVYADKVW